MNTINNNEENSRPFGYWLKAVDRLMAAEFATAFESFGVTRREWRLLNVVDGTVPGEQRPVPVHKLGRLIELGWVTDADGTWTLTDEGRDAKERLGVIVDGIRAKVTDAVPADDLATTVSTLEQLARAFGWDENTPLPKGHGHRHGGGRHGNGRGAHGRRNGRYGRGGNGRGDGRDLGDGFGPHGFAHAPHGAAGHEACQHGEYGSSRHDGHGYGRSADRGFGGHGRGNRRAHFARFAQGAYERGFDAGFGRGRDDR
ncbi:MarR family winged helix-turn-helix transcriptional regulator [Microbacterium profundi]